MLISLVLSLLIACGDKEEDTSVEAVDSAAEEVSQPADEPEDSGAEEDPEQEDTAQSEAE